MNRLTETPMTKQEHMRKMPLTSDKQKPMNSSKPISKGSVPLSEVADAEDLESREDLNSLIDQRSTSKKLRKSRSVTKKIIKI